ncbi:otospiralin-like [Engraulis encrasicolus]|uniref:otospiralin-like n=1 Tax=Engraulis encrasicolus TaxID=184585 RepID=UPI002FD5CA6C
MFGLCALVIVSFVLAGPQCLSGAEEMTASEEHKAPAGGESAAAELVRSRRSMPNWNLWASDFYSWVEELRAQAGYDTLQEMARTFWAHFPIASYLGYDDPEADPEDPGAE